LIWGCY